MWTGTELSFAVDKMVEKAQKERKEGNDKFLPHSLTL